MGSMVGGPSLSAVSAAQEEKWIDPVDFGADPTGVSDSTAALRSALAHAESIETGQRANYWQGQAGHSQTPKKLHPPVYFSSGTLKITSTVEIPEGVTLRLGVSAVIKAGAVIDGPMLTTPDASERTQYHTVIVGDAETALIDCAGKARVGVAIPYAIAAHIANLTVRDWTSSVSKPGGGFWFGRGVSGDDNRSWEIMAANLNTWRTRGTGPGPSPTPGDGSTAIWYRNVSDSHFHKALVNGGSTGVRVDGENNEISFVHVWNTADQPLEKCFVGMRRSRWSHCFADSPTQVGFDFGSPDAAGTMLINSTVFNGGQDGIRVPGGSFVAVGVYMSGDALVNAFVGDTKNASILACQLPAGVDPATRTQSLGLSGAVTRLYGTGLDVIDGAAPSWPGSFKGLRISGPAGGDSAYGLFLGGEDPQSYALPTGARRVIWFTPSSLSAPPSGIAVGLYARSDGTLAVANSTGIHQVVQTRRRVVVSTDTTLSVADETVVCTATLVVTLPDPATLSNIPFTFRVLNTSGGVVTVKSAGSASVRGPASPAQHQWIEYLTDGTHWYGK
ncbi:glycosyl hydrolase family 28-related protein [Microbacterium sp. NPDC056052]|uniref:glycosyl hydrolase family 28-related protein n=1 Tax=Microbacterium sp. NPDC056052 TaxID=3345695 RepID=UPI0035DF6268